MFFKPTAAKLGRKKTRILGVFTKTHNELVSLIEKQLSYESDLSKKIDELETERTLVNRETASTQKLLKKISEFLD
jgi:hypothetical protein